MEWRFYLPCKTVSWEDAEQSRMHSVRTIMIMIIHMNIINTECRLGEATVAHLISQKVIPRTPSTSPEKRGLRLEEFTEGHQLKPLKEIPTMGPTVTSVYR